MAGSPAPLLSRTDEHELHQRLMAGDPIAPVQFAETYLEPLALWVERHHRKTDPALCWEAADRAILAVIHQPDSYNPQRQSLDVYLRMAARGDLLNLLRREQRHTSRRISWAAVELADEQGKYLGRMDDPSRLLEWQETVQAAVPPAVRDNLTEMEGRVLELLLQNERRTAVYARACGFEHLPPAEQARQVKRLKDRLKQRLKRAGGQQ